MLAKELWLRGSVIRLIISSIWLPSSFLLAINFAAKYKMLIRVTCTCFALTPFKAGVEMVLSGDRLCSH